MRPLRSADAESGNSDYADCIEIAHPELGSSGLRNASELVGKILALQTYRIPKSAGSLLSTEDSSMLLDRLKNGITSAKTQSSITAFYGAVAK